MKARDFVIRHLKRGFSRTNALTGVVLGFLLASAGLYAADLVSSLITFNAGDPASASQVNYNFQTLASAIERNRQGVACQNSSAFPASSSASSAYPCDVCIKGYPTVPTGTDLFTASESGIYQIRRYLMANTNSTATSGHMTASSMGWVYINGTTASDNYQEEYLLSSGDVIRIMIHDSSSGGSYYIMPGSYVYVKRIF